MTDSIAIVESILHVSRRSGALRTRSAAKTARALRHTCVEWRRTDVAPVTPDLRGAPAWLGYEMRVFRLGKALAVVMRKFGLWNDKGEVLDAVAAIAADASYGRGRQPFPALLGAFGGAAYADELRALLRDPELCGHVIKALDAAGLGAYVEDVRPFVADAKRPWVQNAAKRYVERFGDGAASRTRRKRRGLTTRETPIARA